MTTDVSYSAERNGTVVDQVLPCDETVMRTAERIRTFEKPAFRIGWHTHLDGANGALCMGYAPISEGMVQAVDFIPDELTTLHVHEEPNNKFAYMETASGVILSCRCASLSTRCVRCRR